MEFSTTINTIAVPARARVSRTVTKRPYTWGPGAGLLLLQTALILCHTPSWHVTKMISQIHLLASWAMNLRLQP